MDITVTSSVRVQLSEEGDGWIVLAEDGLGNSQVVGEPHDNIDEALTAAVRLGCPSVTLSNQSVIDRLPPKRDRPTF